MLYPFINCSEMSHNGKRTELVYSHGLTELQLNLQSECSFLLVSSYVFIQYINCKRLTVYNNKSNKINRNIIGVEQW